MISTILCILLCKRQADIVDPARAWQVFLASKLAIAASNLLSHTSSIIIGPLLLFLHINADYDTFYCLCNRGMSGHLGVQ